MKTIDTAELASVTGGVQQAPKPVAPPQPSPTAAPTAAPPPATGGLVNMSSTAVRSTIGSWFGWQRNSSTSDNN